jgi:PST family polysaccharide transporter
VKISFRAIATQLKALDSPFARNVGWLGGSGAVIRVSRLITTIILARFLSPHDYGLAAVVLTTNEFIRVFARNGIGIRLIQVEEKQLEDLAQSAYWLNWTIFISLFVIQCLTAFPIAWFYRDNSLIVPICGMAFNLLLLPVGMVQAALIQREGRFKAIALTDMLQVCTDNILSAVFAIAGLGMWAIVLPKMLVAPIWVYGILKNHSWRPKEQFTTARWGELMRFGLSVLTWITLSSDAFLVLKHWEFIILLLMQVLALVLGLFPRLNQLCSRICAMRDQIWFNFAGAIKVA